MVKLIRLFSVNTFYLVSFIFLSSLFVSENVFSRNHWEKNFTKVTYDPTENAILIRFTVFEYQFKVNSFQKCRAFLSECDFHFTTDGNNYTRLMRAETKDQEDSGITEMIMKCKHPDTELVLIGSRKSRSVTKWHNNPKNVNIRMENLFKYYDQMDAIGVLTVKWLLGDKYKYVDRIRLNGVWMMTGFGHDNIKDEYYDISSSSILKSTVNQSENNQVKVASQADAIVITGAENGENIKVYNLAGVEVQSTVTKGDVVNIKLPKNQIYFVNIGQARYKVAM